MTIQANQRPVTTYRLIESDLRRRISSGVIPAGMKLPGRSALAKEYNVALKTVERAVASLLKDGTLRADSRRGTYVTDQSIRPRPMLDAAPPPLVLGMVVNMIPPRNHWIETIMQAMERILLHVGGVTLVYNTWRGLESIPMAEAVAALKAEGATAIALIQLTEVAIQAPDLGNVLDTAATPVVYITWDEAPGAALNVYYQSAFAGTQAANHLLKEGYRGMGFVLSESMPWAHERLSAVREALSGHGLHPESLKVVERVAGESLEACAGRAVDSLLGQPGLAPGIIAANDHAAIAFLNAAHARHKKAGRDYGLVGFDDIPEARSAHLTTMRPPLETMGEESARLVLRWIQGDRTASQIRLSSNLVPRLSSYQARKAVISNQ